MFLKDTFFQVQLKFSRCCIEAFVDGIKKLCGYWFTEGQEMWSCGL